MFMRYQLKQVFVIKNKNKRDKNWHYMVFPVLTLIYVELLKNFKKMHISLKNNADLL